MSLGPPSLTRAGSSRDSDSTHTPLFRQVTKGGFDGTQSPINVLMVGSGEYTTGFVNGSASKSDKAPGVVALTMFDLRNRGKVERLAICGVNGMKFPAIRDHMNKAIADVYDGLDVTVDTFPADDAVDPCAYVAALDSFHPGDAVTIFTPDDTHFEIAMAAVERGLHVLLTKPAVMTLEHHRLLHQASVKKGVIVSVEVHKRWDPMYADARDRIKQLGQFSYLYAYMSQPKSQLQTFKSWAGKSSDISYYLNSHHIDFHEWAVGETSRPVKVTATASYGIAKALHNMDCEDTITLTVLWENFEITGEDGEEHKTIRVTGAGTAVYTSSWVAPKSDVHSQQRFFYMGQKGEVTVDQAHRGYSMSSDADGYRSVNPLFMKYTPTDGKFSGQLGYGYRSLEAFVDAAAAVNAGPAQPCDYDYSLASIATTYRTTAILEAGRRSLDGDCSVRILYEDAVQPWQPTGLDVPALTRTHTASASAK